MKTIVITGSTRGIGYALAHEFLARGCRVVVGGRSQASTQAAVSNLAEQHSSDHIVGQACDVSDFEQVQALWNAAKNAFGEVDIWINNAGVSCPVGPVHEQAADLMQAVVTTNMLGTLYGLKVAINGMLEQGHGTVYVMEGAGSDGNVRHGLALYGSTKYGLRFITNALEDELKDTPVKLGTLSPGMLVTQLVTDQFAGREAQFERYRRVFNIIMDRVETVAPWLVERMLDNDKHAARIRWLTRPKVLWRFATAPFKRGRDVFGGWSPGEPL